MLITIQSKSLLGLKYDIFTDHKIGEINIPFTRLLGSSQFGDIRIALQSELYRIKVPLKGDRRVGFGVSGYELVSGDRQISEVSFPPRGASEKLTVNWKDNQITYDIVQGQCQITINNVKVGSLLEKRGFKKTACMDISIEIPIAVLVFWYLSFSYYKVISS